MNIQVRKLNLIEHLILLNDNAVLTRIEDLLGAGKGGMNRKDFKPMSLEEFYARVEESELAIKNKKVISQDALEKESENW